MRAWQLVLVCIWLLATYCIAKQKSERFNTAGGSNTRHVVPKHVNSRPVFQSLNVLHSNLAFKGGAFQDENDEDFKIEQQVQSEPESISEKVGAVLQTLADVLKNLLQSLLGGVTSGVENALQRFEKEYGTNHPEFFAGSFSQATDFARQKGIFTVVYIRPNNGAKGKTKKQDDRVCGALTDKKVIYQINKHFAFWSTAQSSKQAGQLASLLGEKKYPILAVIYTSASNGKRKVIAKHHLNPAPTAPALLSWLEQTRKMNKGLLLGDRRRQEKIQKEIALMKEQREAYKQSIQQDKLNEIQEEKKRQEELERQAEEEERKRKEEEEKALIAQRRAAKKEALGTEPPPDGAPVVTVQLRFADGRRARRRFLASELLEKVFDWADTEEVDINQAKLVSTYPPRTFTVNENQADSLADLLGHQAKTLSLSVDEPIVKKVTAAEGKDEEEEINQEPKDNGDDGVSSCG